MAGMKLRLFDDFRLSHVTNSFERGSCFTLCVAGCLVRTCLVGGGLENFLRCAGLLVGYPPSKEGVHPVEAKVHQVKSTLSENKASVARPKNRKLSVQATVNKE